MTARAAEIRARTKTDDPIERLAADIELGDYMHDRATASDRARLAAMREAEAESKRAIARATRAKTDRDRLRSK